ncbi:hypothetical protein CRG98_026655 [Punica granatum]|uniref:Uncharacterized protein n=1 Tax=Punica granatum TaxID=22663 RepID=A0A2I0J9N9_PUNGR|nr:hypothetical protein CRG98_026655 [Punica granatum]
MGYIRWSSLGRPPPPQGRSSVTREPVLLCCGSQYTSLGSEADAPRIDLSPPLLKFLLLVGSRGVGVRRNYEADPAAGQEAVAERGVVGALRCCCASLPRDSD